MLAHADNVYHKLMDLLLEPLLNDLMKATYVRADKGRDEEGATYFNALCADLERFWRESALEFDESIAEDLYVANSVSLRLSSYDEVVKATMPRWRAWRGSTRRRRPSGAWSS